MNIIISGKQIELTDAIKSKIENKLSKLDNYIHPDTDVKVTVSAKKARQKIEVTIATVNGPIIRAEDMQENLYTAIDVVYDKLSKQLKKYKKRLQDKHKDNKSIRFQDAEINLADEQEDYGDENQELVIQRRKKFSVKPMSEEEAVLQMELIGHDFYMFKNIDSDEIAVVYKRHNGGYGIIEHE
ncbi:MULTISPECIES: ribosome hibernation-promoting factor, HPF/YfiA family [unclassified Clostridioides]|uniref:ribosome hibernation-promoting factor, HPF/YfiA family n=1 Tax=unclassified Clostridioides TaxID=2635829 RepID=UPI0006BBEDAA|nr:RNA-binding protein [Clostridioides difficile]MCC0692409.1 ribosome-associated translation inhibitor RaiA [Clostridioides sp. ZZV14-6387]KPI56369.1 RNA-binding protein [Clostridioides difficile]MCI9976857.1 ribosome-associated translation inhibitor RaiA [Clostridioides difficile]MDB3085981.1 ribosome-associated translation inhibitor RaiA [Clostridioides difficile]